VKKYFRISPLGITLAVVSLLLLFMLGMVLYFIATPADKRITDPIVSEYSVTDPGFKVESGIFSGRQWMEGNTIEIMGRGQQVFHSMLNDIGSAEKSITKETYEFWGENIATSVSLALAEASGRGVETHFMMDYMGSVKATTEQFEHMEEAGVEVIRWRKPSWYQTSMINHRTYRKLLVVDGRVAYMGGMNTADPWLTEMEDGGNKDYHFRLTGPVVNEVQGLFSINWVTSTGRLLSGDRYYRGAEPTGLVSMQVTSGNPLEGRMPVRKMMLYAIASASESIRIGTAYFYPDQGFLDALKAAAGRGVQIRMILPGEKIDKNYVRAATYTILEQLLESGIEIYEYLPAKYHAKVMIVDDYFVSVGSTNIDNRSFTLNDEANLNILNSDFGQEMAALFDEDLESSEQITEEKVRNRSLWSRISGWLTSNVLGSYI